jgi:hypothetical protein
MVRLDDNMLLRLTRILRVSYYVLSSRPLDIGNIHHLINIVACVLVSLVTGSLDYRVNHDRDVLVG